MNTLLRNTVGAISISLLTVLSAHATLTENDIAIYNQAAAGDEDQVEPAYYVFKQLIKNEGATALTLVYLGSIETLKGRDAWMPWTAMKHVEKGLSTIDKGLTLLASEPNIEQQSRYMGLNESYLARALAATTYSSLPDMFNHFERGYDLFVELLAEPQFEQQPFPATAWIYNYAVQAALRANDIQQAQQWLNTMRQQDKTHPETLSAQEAVKGEQS
ncbi:hypothetical protein CW745_02600 [Psychromonas sp. psych-6C06]|uniref:hypothetical protein n=1 Tax=Psychromonas sp. psych-6C06 TaxID=2058089 RepID=UPI000C3356E2|nr:hypothetical protein [Psychromonas sp. psych-6C06]PKF63748.1 hypothetical protein CW745_02600 [Psychromonas sp. psych-6C06]